ncbi:Hypothetical protein AT6N2_L0842 [Agrobacterium tumefaciens]|nr:Hypothetical protein AT6N2_L0842 [Agrobacterium tumefaciens]
MQRLRVRYAPANVFIMEDARIPVTRRISEQKLAFDQRWLRVPTLVVPTNEISTDS